MKTSEDVVKKDIIIEQMEKELKHLERERAELIIELSSYIKRVGLYRYHHIMKETASFRNPLKIVR